MTKRNDLKNQTIVLATIYSFRTGIDMNIFILSIRDRQPFVFRDTAVFHNFRQSFKKTFSLGDVSNEKLLDWRILNMYYIINLGIDTKKCLYRENPFPEFIIPDIDRVAEEMTELTSTDILELYNHHVADNYNSSKKKTFFGNPVIISWKSDLIKERIRSRVRYFNEQRSRLLERANELEKMNQVVFRDIDK